MRHTLYEIVEKAQALPRAEAIAWLKQNDTKPLRQVFRFIYDKSLEVLLPNTLPPLKKSAVPEEELMFTALVEARRLRIFVKGQGYDNLAVLKRESLFIEILQNLHPKDVAVLAHGLSRKPIKGITEKLLLEAFPGLFETPLA